MALALRLLGAEMLATDSLKACSRLGYRLWAFGAEAVWATMASKELLRDMLMVAAALEGWLMREVHSWDIWAKARRISFTRHTAATRSLTGGGGSSACIN